MLSAEKDFVSRENETDGAFLNINFYISSKRLCAIKKISDEFLWKKSDWH